MNDNCQAFLRQLLILPTKKGGKGGKREIGVKEVMIVRLIILIVFCSSSFDFNLRNRCRFLDGEIRARFVV